MKSNSVPFTKKFSKTSRNAVETQKEDTPSPIDEDFGNQITRTNIVSEGESDGDCGCPTPPKYIIKERIDSRIAAVCEKQALIEIPVVGEFNEQMADMFELLMQRAIWAEHKTVVIRVNSPGGSVYALNRMLGTLDLAKQMGITCITMCTGIAMSCGSIMLAMGTKGHRYCSRHARILLHEISGGVRGAQTNMENELTEYSYDNSDLFRKIARNAGLDADYYLQFVKQLHRDLFIHPARAMYIGLVDHIDLPFFTKTVTIEYKAHLPCEDPTPEELKAMIDSESKTMKQEHLDVLAEIPAPKAGEKNDPFLCKKKQGGDDQKLEAVIFSAKSKRLPNF